VLIAGDNRDWIMFMKSVNKALGIILEYMAQGIIITYKAARMIIGHMAPDILIISKM
jgi:hypothetical protein